MDPKEGECAVSYRNSPLVSEEKPHDFENKKLKGLKQALIEAKLDRPKARVARTKEDFM